MLPAACKKETHALALCLRVQMLLAPVALLALVVAMVMAMALAALAEEAGIGERSCQQQPCWVWYLCRSLLFLTSQHSQGCDAEADVEEERNDNRIFPRSWSLLGAEAEEDKEEVGGDTLIRRDASIAQNSTLRSIDQTASI